MEDLYYLIHNKSHVINNGPNDDLNEAISKFGQMTNKILYRGLSDKELNGIMTGNHVVEYMSFSEDENIAQRFGKHVIKLQLKVNAFCLWQWGVHDILSLKFNSPGQYESSDGDYILESFLEEKEWILPHRQPLTLVDKDELLFVAQ